MDMERIQMAGQKLNKLKEHYGAEKLLATPGLLENALPDVLGDDRKMVNLLTMAISCGADRVLYQQAAQAEGSKELKQYMLDQLVDGGMNTMAANEAVEVFWGMMGWKAGTPQPAQPPERKPGEERYRPGTEPAPLPERKPGEEIYRPGTEPKPKPTEDVEKKEYPHKAEDQPSTLTVWNSHPVPTYSWKAFLGELLGAYIVLAALFILFDWERIINPINPDDGWIELVAMLFAALIAVIPFWGIKKCVEYFQRPKYRNLGSGRIVCEYTKSQSNVRYGIAINERWVATDVAFPVTIDTNSSGISCKITVASLSSEGHVAYVWSSSHTPV